MPEIALNILDVAENSVRAGASLVEITVAVDEGEDTLSVTIADDGCGMTDEQIRQVTDPFFTTRTTRKVGLGVPFFKQAAELTGGSFSIDSEVGKGTVVTAVFCTDSIDFTPLGNVEDSICALASMNENIDFVYTRRLDEREFVFSSGEIRTMLDGVPMNEPSVMQWLGEYLAEQAAALHRDKPSENQGGQQQA